METSRHIVFIHGFLESAEMWQPLLGHLSKSKLNIHFPELPGHGKNLVIPKDWNMDVWVENILDQIGLGEKENAFFIGHSMGGYLASNIARLHPKKVRALCLFHSKVGADSEEKKINRTRAITAAELNRTLYVRTMINALFYADGANKYIGEKEVQIAYASQLSLNTIVASQTVMRDRKDCMQAMRDRQFPLYYFLGDEDSSLPKLVMQDEILQLPGAVAHFEEKVGHMGHIECPKVAGEFIQRVLRTDF